MASPVDSDKCDICKYFDKYVPAKAVCKTCAELYCLQCSLYHKAFSVSRKHVLLRSRSGSGAITRSIIAAATSDLEELTFASNDTRSKKTATKNTDKTATTKPSIVFAPSFIGEFELHAASDAKSSFVHCITCLPDDRIVVVDWNNQRLKVFDRYGKLEVSEPVDFNSWGVTCTGVDEVAVTNAKQIDFYSIGTNKITKLSKCLKISCHGRGICNYDNKRFVIADESGVILIIDEKGRVVKEFKLFDAFGNKITRCYEAIFDHNGENVIVADRTMGSFRVICLSITSGKALWEVPMATKPYGMVSVGASDTLLVSSSPKNAIYKIDTVKREIGMALNEEDSIYQPEGMVIQYGLGRLLIADTDCVKIFSLY